MKYIQYPKLLKGSQNKTTVLAALINKFNITVFIKREWGKCYAY